MALHNRTTALILRLLPAHLPPNYAHQLQYNVTQFLLVPILLFVIFRSSDVAKSLASSYYLVLQIFLRKPSIHQSNCLHRSTVPIFSLTHTPLTLILTKAGYSSTSSLVEGSTRENGAATEALALAPSLVPRWKDKAPSFLHGLHPYPSNEGGVPRLFDR